MEGEDEDDEGDNFNDFGAAATSGNQKARPTLAQEKDKTV